MLSMAQGFHVSRPGDCNIKCMKDITSTCGTSLGVFGEQNTYAPSVPTHTRRGRVCLVGKMRGVYEE